MIGLIGGMSWESTKVYYELLNRFVRERDGGLHSANIILRSLDFAPIAQLQHQGKWDELGRLLTQEALLLQDARATCVALATNTMHKVADQLEEALSIPLVHIADAVGQQAVKEGYEQLCLLGTRFTMQEAFYKDRLQQKFGLNVQVPNEADQEMVHKIIYEELVKGVLNPASTQALQEFVFLRSKEGDEAVVLGCTELPLLLRQEHSPLALLDTTELHAKSLLAYT